MPTIWNWFAKSMCSSASYSTNPTRSHSKIAATGASVFFGRHSTDLPEPKTWTYWAPRAIWLDTRPWSGRLWNDQNFTPHDDPGRYHYPARVLVFWRWVAGLQAIYRQTTRCHRWGYRHSSETKEQTESLGAKFIEVEHDQNQEASVYAKVASKTMPASNGKPSAQIAAPSRFGHHHRHSPRTQIASVDWWRTGKPHENGSVIIDLAADQGGVRKQTTRNRSEKWSENYWYDHIPRKCFIPTPVNCLARTYFSSTTSPRIPQFEYNFEDEITNATLIVQNGTIRQNGKKQLIMNLDFITSPPNGLHHRVDGICGVEVISHVRVLHTPLMSGANAIHGGHHYQGAILVMLGVDPENYLGPGPRFVPSFGDPQCSGRFCSHRSHAEMFKKKKQWTILSASN